MSAHTPRAALPVIATALAWLGGTALAQAAGSAPAREALRADTGRIERAILDLSRFGVTPEGGVSRVAFSEADLAAREHVKALMQDAGLTVRVDTAGNIIGRREGSGPSLPAIVTGSHVDSVPGGGRYDGNVGVVGAIEAARILREGGVTLRHPLEVIVFADEEGGLVGSRAVIGELKGKALDVVSHSGLAVREGLRVLGGDPDRLEEARREPGEIEAFVELHIEQGRLLEMGAIQIGVVEGIVGIEWWEITVQGKANHAGTTPMRERQDALVAASRLVVEVNRLALETPGRHVATVGRMRVEPGAPNVIPGRVVMSLEIRDLSAEKIRSLHAAVEAAARRLAAETETAITFSHLDTASVPAPTDERMRDLIEESARGLGLSTMRMPSGAGHDAQDMARIAPTGMIFVPSAGGISHAPAEFTAPGDMANGVNVLIRTILRIDEGALH